MKKLLPAVLLFAYPLGAFAESAMQVLEERAPEGTAAHVSPRRPEATSVTVAPSAADVRAKLPGDPKHSQRLHVVQQANCRLKHPCPVIPAVPGLPTFAEAQALFNTGSMPRIDGLIDLTQQKRIPDDKGNDLGYRKDGAWIARAEIALNEEVEAGLGVENLYNGGNALENPGPINNSRNQKRKHNQPGNNYAALDFSQSTLTVPEDTPIPGIVRQLVDNGLSASIGGLGDYLDMGYNQYGIKADFNEQNRTVSFKQEGYYYPRNYGGLLALQATQVFFIYECRSIGDLPHSLICALREQIDPGHENSYTVVNNKYNGKIVGFMIYDFAGQGAQ